MPKVFVSYRRVEPDQSLALFLVEYLNRNGLSTFIDQQMLAGARWSEEIEGHLRSSDFFIVLLSKDSIEHGMVEDEVAIAKELSQQPSRRYVILPVRVSFAGELPLAFSYLNRFQQSNWQEGEPLEAIGEKLLAAINHSTVRSQPSKRDGEPPVANTLQSDIRQAVLSAAPQVMQPEGQSGKTFLRRDAPLNFPENFCPHVPKDRSEERVGRFVDREQVEVVKTYLRDRKHVGLVSVMGMGGVGKTWLAAKVVEDFHDDEPDLFPQGICWHRVGSNPTETSLSDLAAKFGADWIANSNDEKLRKTHLRWLFGHVIKNALIVLDNVDKEELLRPLTDMLQGVPVLITSRLRFSNVQPVELGRMNAEQSRELFRTHYPEAYKFSGNELDQVLMGRFHGHPLTIRLAASYADQLGLSLNLLVQDLDRNGLSSLSDFWNADINIKACAEASKSALEQKYPHIWQWFLLAGLMPDSFEAEDLLTVASKVELETDGDLEQQLRVLRNYSLLECHDRRYNVHPMLQDYSATVASELLPEAQGGVLRYYLKDMGDDRLVDISSPPVAAFLKAFDKVIELSERDKGNFDSLIVAGASRPLIEIDFYLKGRWPEAVRYLTQGYEAAERLGWRNRKRYRRQVALLKRKAGDILARSGRYTEAEPLLIEAESQLRQMGKAIEADWAGYWAASCLDFPDSWYKTLTVWHRCSVNHESRNESPYPGLLRNIGDEFLGIGLHRQACCYYELALAQRQTSADWGNAIRHLGAIAYLLLETRGVGEARAYWTRRKDIWSKYLGGNEELDDSLGTRGLTWCISDFEDEGLHLGEQELHRLVDWADDLEERAKKRGDLDRWRACLLLKVRAYMAGGLWDQAEGILSKLRELLSGKEGNETHKVNLDHWQSRLLFQQGNLLAALKLAERVTQLANDELMASTLLESAALQAAIQWRLGRKQEAVKVQRRVEMTRKQWDHTKEFPIENWLREVREGTDGLSYAEVRRIEESLGQSHDAGQPYSLHHPYFSVLEDEKRVPNEITWRSDGQKMCLFNRDIFQHGDDTERLQPPFYIDREPVRMEQAEKFLFESDLWETHRESLRACGTYALFPYDLAVKYAEWSGKKLPVAKEWKIANPVILPPVQDATVTIVLESSAKLNQLLHHQLFVLNEALGTQELIDPFAGIPLPSEAIDPHYFFVLLGLSASLSIEEKRKIIESIPKLSAYQVEELVRIFEEEQEKFADLNQKHPEQITSLYRQHYREWIMLLVELIGSQISVEVDQQDLNTRLLPAGIWAENEDGVPQIVASPVLEELIKQTESALLPSLSAWAAEYQPPVREDGDRESGEKMIIDDGEDYASDDEDEDADLMSALASLDKGEDVASKEVEEEFGFNREDWEMENEDAESDYESDIFSDINGRDEDEDDDDEFTERPISQGDDGDLDGELTFDDTDDFQREQPPPNQPALLFCVVPLIEPLNELMRKADF